MPARGLPKWRQHIGRIGNGVPLSVGDVRLGSVSAEGETVPIADVWTDSGNDCHHPVFPLRKVRFMHFAPWLLFTILALTCFGVVGLLQKLSTDLISAESALVWLIVGFLILQPFLYPGQSLFTYSPRSIAYVFLGGLLNALGSWAILAAMKSGGKASIVVPFTAVYPMVVCVVAPFLLHEHITMMQTVGIACGMGAIFLLAK